MAQQTHRDGSTSGRDGDAGPGLVQQVGAAMPAFIGWCGMVAAAGLVAGFVPPEIALVAFLTACATLVLVGHRGIETGWSDGE